VDTTAASTLFAWLDREIWLLTAEAEAKRGGLIATFVAQASIVPDLPRMLVGLSRRHHTWELVERSNSFALHLIDEQHLDWIRRFGLESGRDKDKFDGLNVRRAGTGSPLLEDAIGWLDCRVENRMESGDRTIYLAEVVQGGVSNYAQPLTFRRVMQIAHPTLLAELKRQLHQDSERDAELIRQWRSKTSVANSQRGATG
jgi:flavin reductase (DIM6/NTAB) family NADH-FMN oxidoreductase RutF